MKGLRVNELPQYKCHKEVRAMKIIGVGKTTLDLSNGEVVTSAGKWIKRFEPKEGGYMVIYEDGYTSFSPAKSFEEGYTLV